MSEASTIAPISYEWEKRQGEVTCFALEGATREKAWTNTQGSLTPVRQLCACLETRALTLPNRRTWYREKGTGNPVGLCYSSTSLKQWFSGSLSESKCFIDNESETAPSTCNKRGVEGAHFLGFKTQLLLHGFGRNQPQRAR